VTDSSADRDPLDCLAEEFVARLRRGEHPAVSEYADRHPELAEQVRDLFPALVELEQVKPATGDHTGDFESTGDPTDPDRVGEFRILRRVGHGGMGVVYEAVQESLGRHVALKLLPAEAVADPATDPCSRLPRPPRHGTTATSPPARVARAGRTDAASNVRNRTEPSAMAKYAPPGCVLQNPNAEQSSAGVRGRKS